jgi:hypothetical protein
MRSAPQSLTLPTRALTGQQIISSEGWGASSAFIPHARSTSARAGQRTSQERLLPKLLPNSTARGEMGRDKERFGTAKS